MAIEPALDSVLVSDFVNSALSLEPVSGLTHNFYYYPARFSPLFARAAIKLFTQPGDLVLDPFMGGGTSLVEAQSLGRRALGVDISSLATFVARVKTTLLSEGDISTLCKWFTKLPEQLNLHKPPVRAHDWIAAGYQRNFSDRRTWPIRKTLELAVECLKDLQTPQQQDFARCVLLKVGQWAVHRRNHLPKASQFRNQIVFFASEMLNGMTELRNRVDLSSAKFGVTSHAPICLHHTAAGLDNILAHQAYQTPKLILTSPPYPGVHVLYHRWQINARKETPAPFWIANCLDGRGASYYTFGGRHQPDLETYFVHLQSCFSAVAKLMTPDTLLIQLVGFSDRAAQLEFYLESLKLAGLDEICFPQFANSLDGRLWRQVPNRRWYANRPQATESSYEVVLFHRLASRHLPQFNS